MCFCWRQSSLVAVVHGKMQLNCKLQEVGGAMSLSSLSLSYKCIHVYRRLVFTHCVSSIEAWMHHQRAPPAALWPPQGESSETALLLPTICSNTQENLQPSSIWHCVWDYVTFVWRMNYVAEWSLWFPAGSADLHLKLLFDVSIWYTETELLQEEVDIGRVWLWGYCPKFCHTHEHFRCCFLTSICD